MTALCIARDEKGHALIRELRKHGWSVVLITSARLKEQGTWPAEAIDEFVSVPDADQKWEPAQIANTVSYLARSRQFDRIIALDDLDVELAAHLREHLRMAGMGESAVRYFRDKLAMRVRAAEAGLPIPEFVGAINYDRLRDFLRRVPAPWVLKPRSLAGAVGIRKLWNSDEIWSMLDRLEGLQSHYLVERFVPGDVFHVDSIVHNGEIRFAIASGYGRPPMEIAHEGGIFTTRILERGSDLAAALLAENARVLRTMGLRSGASHTEFIRDAASGQLLFLETSARVGGAHIAEMVEAATGLNLWAEWARVEIAGEGGEYEPPADCRLFAGLLISLARQPHPNTSTYNDPEIVWRIDREHHVGFVIRSHNYNRVKELLGQYLQRVQADFQASLPPREAPAY